MALKIRLARGGEKKRPFYRIVVAENTNPRDGRFLERLGHYNPIAKAEDPERVVLNVERIKHWIAQGAKPSERVALFLSKAGVVSATPQPNRPQKSMPKSKAQERLKAASEKAEA